MLTRKDVYMLTNEQIELEHPGTNPVCEPYIHNMPEDRENVAVSNLTTKLEVELLGMCEHRVEAARLERNSIKADIVAGSFKHYANLYLAGSIPIKEVLRQAELIKDRIYYLVD